MSTWSAQSSVTPQSTSDQLTHVPPPPLPSGTGTFQGCRDPQLFQLGGRGHRAGGTGRGLVRGEGAGLEGER